MNVTLYTFAKRPDSTKRPPQGGLTLSATLKDSTSLLSPVLLFALSGNPTPYNYAYIPDFGRYYYINDWAAIAGMWEASCKVDTLASWKDSIGESTQYVLRAESESDGYITDTTYPAFSDTYTAYKILENSPINPNVPVYVIGIIGQGPKVNGQPTTVNGVTYYLCSQAQFALLIAKYLDVNSWGVAFDSLGDDIARAIFNPMQYVTCVYKYPAGLDIGSGSVLTTINAGWYSVEVAAAPLTSTVANFTFKFEDVPTHPQYQPGLEYLNCAPYAAYDLYLPQYGTIHLDGDMLTQRENEYRNVVVHCQIDVANNTSTAAVRINDHLYTTLSGSWGASIQLSQIQTNWTALAGLPDTISNAVTSPSVGSILGAGQGIMSSVLKMAPSARSISSNGDYTQYYQKPEIVCRFKKIVDFDPDGRGRPLCKNRVISSLQGFVQVSDAKVAFDCTPAETTEITSYMEGGFHFE